MKLGQLLAGVLVSVPALVMAQANIENGTLRVGVRADGALMPQEISPLTGITYLANGQDGLTPGCPCEAWGIADALTNTSGFTGSSVGTTGITSESFTSTASTATSVANAFGTFRVTHAFAPSSTNNIYEVKVTIENISSTPVEALYGRAMDWDVFPTQFNEYTTIQRGSSTALVFSSDNGFHTADPLESDPGILFVDQDVVDSGPYDHGAHFRFNFGTIAPGAKVDFTIGYGATDNQVDALAALATFGAEAYSLGKPSENPPGTPNTDGTPNTFIFAFKGIGGVQLIGVDAVDDTAPALTRPTSGSVTAINVLANDTVDAAPATTSNVALTAVGTWPAGITVTPGGDVLVSSAAAPGAYTMSYQICSTEQETQCDTATVTLQVNAPAVVVPKAVPVGHPLVLAGLGLLLLGVARRKLG
ncbi:hypothetical protein [Comamonas sp. JUb58]|uniref:hypothetical protein n=1 Tax=Comamonas sp. JUb58 TaxID=2485114 RepID=UPI00105E33A4|nr:hypothetical protein [Comamonas sp. JUb58]TDS73886.1 hypothetical protein EDF71_11991 [Comamonas sp. JUb58]